MPDIALEPRPGDSVGPYRITRVIGRGRMGIVFEATADGGEPVAVKVVTTELTQDEVFLRRFRREVEAAQRIQHENVVPVLAHGEEGGLPYLVQALIPGGSLAERIVAEGKIGLASTLGLLQGAAAGIDALHAGGLVHRDIKPANILLDGDRAYVSDFGLAKDSQASNLTRPGQALGSLDYMAPEQIRGEDVSPATDIYALGCVFIECLTGAPPFGGRPSMRVLFAHLQDPPPDLTELRPRHPGRRGARGQPGAGEGARGAPGERRGVRPARRASRRLLSEKVHLLPAGAADTVARVSASARRLIVYYAILAAVTVVVVVVVFAAGQRREDAARRSPAATTWRRPPRAAPGCRWTSRSRASSSGCAGPTGRCSRRRGCATGA